MVLKYIVQLVKNNENEMKFIYNHIKGGLEFV